MKKITDKNRMYLLQRRWILILSILALFQLYMFGFNAVEEKKQMKKTTQVRNIVYYKYPLVNSSEILMRINSSTENITSSYDWFMFHRKQFKNLGADEIRTYRNGVPVCHLTMAGLGQISINKSEVDLEWVEEMNPEVKPGGYYAPLHCKPRFKVAILVSYRNREVNLGIFLRYLHPILQKQQLEYRIFVIEQYGSESFNKGTLYNIGFLESQRFGDWQCLIFHDVDLIPMSERILYSCPRKPTHISALVVYEDGSILPAYHGLFGGVTALTMEQYRKVNGYSNLYLNWGAEDDDMYIRVQATRYPVLRYSMSLAQFVALPHKISKSGVNRGILFWYAKKRFRMEGLRSTQYKLINVTMRRLYTHILADVNPLQQPVNSAKFLLKTIKRLFKDTSKQNKTTGTYLITFLIVNKKN